MSDLVKKPKPPLPIWMDYLVIPNDPVQRCNVAASPGEFLESVPLIRYKHGDPYILRLRLQLWQARDYSLFARLRR